MASFIELIAKIKQKNNGDYALVDAEDIECEDGKRLNVVLNEKLDKNQGVENAGKTMVVGADGNLVVGDSSPKNVYTKEEVDYLLNDKMDKPYYDIAITDDTTIENTLAGNFKMDSIEGSIYQAEESGIVPTPQRPVPINSRKVKAGDSYVELRSLKESVNIWDYTNMSSSESGVINTSGWSIGVAELSKTFLKLKSNTQYSFKCDIEMVENVDKETLTKFSTNKMLYLYRVNSDDLPSVNIALGSTDAELENGALITVSNTFTTPADLTGIRITAYTERWTNAENVAYYARVRFKNIMLVEGDTVPSSYIAPTVRDYKIVDPTNKTSKIVRNVISKQLESNDVTGMDGIHAILNNFGIIGKEKISSSYSDKMSYVPKGYETDLFNLFTFSGAGLLEIYIKDYTTLEEYRNWVEQNKPIMQTAAKTPTEESIPYLEDDTSEVGLSWQDTTSPSPDIPSDIYEVDEINIKLTNNNLLNNNIDNWQMRKSLSWGASPGTPISIIESNYSAIIKIDNIKPSTLYSFKNETTSSLWIDRIIEMDNNNLGVLNHKLYRDVSTDNKSEYSFTTRESTSYVYIHVRTLPLSGNGSSDNITNEDIIFSRISFGQGIISKYEAHKELLLNHTLKKPLRATKDKLIFDYIDILKNTEVYSLSKYIITGSESFAGDYESDEYYARYFEVSNGKGNLVDQIYCNGLLYVKFVWGVNKEGVCQDANQRIYIKFSNKRLGITKDTPLSVKQLAFSNYLKQLYDEGKPLYVIMISITTENEIDSELKEKLKQLKTFSPVTHVFVEGIAKPKLNAKYPKDIVLAQQQLEQKVITLQEAVIKNV